MGLISQKFNLPRDSLTADTKQSNFPRNEKVDWPRLEWVTRQVDLLRIVKIVVPLNVTATGSASSQLTKSQLEADVLGTANHVVVEGTLLLDSDVLLLLKQMLALLILWQLALLYTKMIFFWHAQQRP